MSQHPDLAEAITLVRSAEARLRAYLAHYRPRKANAALSTCRADLERAFRALWRHADALGNDLE